MANILLTGDASTTHVLSNGDTIIQSRGSTLAVVSPPVAAIDASNADNYIAILNGEVLVDNDPAILGNSAGTGTSKITIGTDGVIATGGTFAAIIAGSAKTEVTNDGSIYAGGAGISFSTVGGNADIQNYGTVAISGAGYAIDIGFQTDFAHINNDGSLSSTDGIGIGSGAEIETIIFNSGDISGYNYGVLAYSSTMGSSSLVVNSGTIENIGDSGTVALWNESNTFINTGTVLGSDVGYDAGFGETLDVVENSGIIYGDVNLKDGNDTYRGLENGEVVGRVNGGAGNDNLFGSDADDDLRGGNQGDLMEGGGGNDDLLGEQGQDIINGGAGNDRLYGQANGDRLDGGEGLDKLYGGLASDTFIFKQGNDVDIIMDFANNGVEKVDLTDWAAVDAQAAIDAAYQVGTQVRINFGDGDLLAFNGITVADLDASDFILA